MPFAQTYSTRFGDGASAADSTQLADLEITATGGATIRPVSGLGTDILSFPDASRLSVQLAALADFVAADDGARLDIEDDPGTQNDVSFCEYNVAAPAASPALDANVVLQSSSSKLHTYAVGTYDGLRLALADRGY